MMDDLPDGIESVLAAQALFPLAGEEEMLGLPGDRSAPDLPGGHGDRPNEIAIAAAGLDEDEPELFVAVHDALMRRLLGQAGTPLADWQIAYRRLIAEAFPETLLGAVTMGDLANAIGHFQALAFVTRDTPWDRYLAGDKGAIDAAAKEGALLFYGKGRCAACHSGPLLSDFQFHSLAVPQIGPGFDDPGDDSDVESGDDRGRYEATRIPRHLYQFRTPPLRNVTLTAPYFHSGAVASLEDAIACISHRPSARHTSPKPRQSGGRASRARCGAASPSIRRSGRASSPSCTAWRTIRPKTVRSSCPRVCRAASPCRRSPPGAERRAGLSNRFHRKNVILCAGGWILSLRALSGTDRDWREMRVHE